MNKLGTPLPIKVESTSNGEYAPIPVGRTIARATELAALRITENARWKGIERRKFLASLCGVATTLLTLNQAFAARGNTGGRFEVPPTAALDPDAAARATSLFSMPRPIWWNRTHRGVAAPPQDGGVPSNAGPRGRAARQTR